jgi:hypothetical protein
MPGVAGALLSALVFAGPASAAFTATQVTTPANLSHPLSNQDSASATLHIAGTATGTGTTVDIVCVFPQGGASVLQNTVDASSGAFSADIPVSNVPSQPCVIRALPPGVDVATQAPNQSTPWGGSIILPGYRQTRHLGNDTTPVWDVQLGNTKSGGVWNYDSAGACLISSSQLLDAATFDLSDSAFYCNATFFEVNNGNMSPTRSQLVIDSKNAYVPAGASSVNTSASHFPALAPPAVAYDQANGDLSVHYVEQVVRCTGGGNPFPANSGSCTDFEDTGVQLDSWITQNSDASATTVLQRFSATDGNVHNVDALSEQEFQHTNSSGGYIFPWTGSAYQPYVQGATVPPPPPGSGSMFGKNDMASADGSLAGVQGAVTWAAAPESLKVTRGTSDAAGYSEFELGYAKTISPSSPMWLGWSFALGDSQSGIAAAAHDAEAAFTPRIAIASPADGTSTTEATAHVTGTASDNSGDTIAVSVNGHAATVDSGGNWSVDVPLGPGSNTLAATVTNRYGTSASASRTVTHPAAAGEVHVFRGARYRGPHTLRLDRHGNLVLRIACPADSATACSGAVSLVSASAVRAAARRPRAKVLRVGSKKFAVKAGKTGKVKIHVTSKAQRYIAKRHKLRSKLTISSRDVAAAARKKTTARLTIKPAAKKKRKR